MWHVTASGAAELDAGGMQTTLGSVGSKYSSGLQGNLGNGHGIFNTSLPYLSETDGGAGVAVVFDFCTAYWFDDDGVENYTPRHGANVSLEFDYSTCCFTFTGPNGGVWRFDEFGVFKSSTTAGGQSIHAASYNSAGQVTQLVRQVDDGGQTVTDQLNYQYYDSGDNSGLIESITSSRQSSPAVDLQRMVYTYYGASEANGNVGDLKTSTRQKNEGGQWLDLEKRYFRYYQDGEMNGVEHGLKYAVGPEGCRRLEQATGDPLSASDAQVAQQADYYYQYDAQRRVTYSETSGGSNSYSIGYAESSHADDYNHWRRKTTTTRADGTSETVYTNYVSDVILRDAADGASHWIEYHQYNAQAREILRANPSAVIGYDEAVADLNVSLRSADGLIHTTEYYQTTTADETTAGGVVGRVKSQSIQRGTTGTPVKQSEYQYFARSASVGGKVYPIAAETVYRNEDGTGAISTSFSYTWHGDTAQMEERATTLPAIPASQNGSGISNTRTERFDTDGRLIWQKDERGFITRQVYDPVTESLIQTIQDVDTAQVSDQPAGWSTPAGGGKHIVSDLEHDALGRIIQELGPEHEVDIDGTATNVRTASWTVYDDENREVRSAQGYATGASWDTFTLVNPVSITKMDHAGRTVEEIQATRASTNGKLAESDSFAQSTYVRWSTSSYNDEGHLEHTRVYHTIPSSGAGSSGTNYGETTYGYDAMSRQNKVTSPGGTITRTVFTTVGRNSIPSKTYIGTDDTAATESDPTGSGHPDNNMVLVSESEYDNGNPGGDGLLTKQTEHVDALTSRETSFTYDWRGRQTDDDGEEDFYQVSVFDNLDRVTRIDRHDTTSSGNLIARSETKYDDLGRVYQTKRYAVNVSTGTVRNSLTDNTWYDEVGNVIKEHPAGIEAFTKYQFDSLGRQVKQFIGFDVGESSYAEATNVTGDTIFEQSETDYDHASTVIETRLRRRHHDAIGTGELTTPTGSNPKARVSYVAFYSDAVGRQIAIANYGTNDDVPLSRASTVPTRSDEILVTTTEYNDTGEAYKAIDPAHKEDRTEFDDAGRITKQIENYTDGDPTTGGNDEDITVCFTYTAHGQQATITAKQKSPSDDQTTKYVYGTSLSDSDVARSDLLRAVIYPDSDDSGIGVPPVLGNGPDGIYDRVEHKYNRQGEVIETKDQNETVHAFDYDKLARQIHDRVTTLGTDIDGAVRRISTTYEVRGQLQKITSYDDATGGNVVNEVLREYNDFGLLDKEYQEHDGAKDANTLYVGYNYDETASGGEFTKGLRPQSIRYPDGRLVHYTYGSSGSDADNLNRLDAIKDDNSGSPGDILASYKYLGLGQMVIEAYEQPELRLDYFGGSSGAYVGFDRFDRIVDQRWHHYGTSEDRDRFKYGYDRASNRTWKENTVSKNLETPVYLDEFYTYDGVNRLTNMERGQLNGTKTGITGTPSREEDWALDPLGNWSNYIRKTSGATDLDHDRSVNKANEITDITETTGTSWPTPSHDRAGNMTSIPQPADLANDYDLTWDAWNRLVKVEDDSTTVAEYSYDAATRRIRKDVTGSPDSYQHFFYNSSWQALETRESSTASVPSTTEYQYVWSLRYIDAPILRDDIAADPDERIYYLGDANFNITTLINTDSTTLERYVYTPYGVSTIYDDDWSTSQTRSLYDNAYTFTGRRLDDEMGIFYFRSRYFFPFFGRFLVRDPIGYVDGFSLYSAYFVPNGLDPSGTKVVIALEKDQQTFVKLFNQLCPEAKVSLRKNELYSAALGFCRRERFCVQENMGGPLVSRIEGPTVRRAKHPFSCKCVCDALNSNRIFSMRLKVRTVRDIIRQARWTPEQRARALEGGRARVNANPTIIVGTPPSGGLLGVGDTKSPGGNRHRVRAPQFIILGHELCGHALPRLPHMAGWGGWLWETYTSMDPVIVIENIIRREHSTAKDDYGQRGNDLVP